MCDVCFHGFHVILRGHKGGGVTEAKIKTQGRRYVEIDYNIRKTRDGVGLVKTKNTRWG